MKLDIGREIEKICEQYAGEHWVDAKVYRYNHGNFSIVFSKDLTYYHTTEILCSDVLYFCGPFSWSTSPKSHSVARLLDKNESKNFAVANLVEIPSIMVRFGNDDNVSIFVVSRHIEVNFDTVYYYHRQNLTEGERLAYWLSKEE